MATEQSVGVNFSIEVPISKCVKLTTEANYYDSSFLRGTAVCLSIVAESDHFSKKMLEGLSLCLST